jgi:hypothetical protein
MTRFLSTGHAVVAGNYLVDLIVEIGFQESVAA